MYPTANVRGGTADRSDRNSNSPRVPPLRLMVINRIDQKTPRVIPESSDVERSTAQQLGTTRPLGHIPAGWIVGGIVAGLLFLLLVIVRPWLPDITISGRHDVPTSKPTSDSVASTAPEESQAVEQTHRDRNVIPIRPLTNLPGQKPTIAVVIPRGASPPNEQSPELPLKTETSPSLVSPPNSGNAVATPPQLALGEVEDAKRVQQRLIDLGYLFGAADGVWGLRSRKALQEFKAANGIGDGDTWDDATQERLLASDAVAANTSEITFIGGWGVDAAQCRESPLTITERRAEAFGAACEFGSTQRESANAWRLRAQCANGSERWNASIRFAISGSKLTWSSERGTTTYVRCST